MFFFGRAAQALNSVCPADTNISQYFSKTTLARALKLLIIATPLLTFSVSANAPINTRIALVIGNSAYANSPLLNPVNDAKAMSKTLSDLGFEVIVILDANKAQMKKAINQMSDELKGKEGVGLLYYAGHGVQMDERNYMIPVDAKINLADDIQTQTLELNTVLDGLKKAGSRMNIIVLDACRNNPFDAVASGRALKLKSSDPAVSRKGLAPMDVPSGTFLAYATAPGNIAEDGNAKSKHGLYTQFLLQEIKNPQSRIEDVFKRVRFKVRQKSDGRQIPWESTSLEDDFVFSDGRPAKHPKIDQDTLEAEFNNEKSLWDRIKNSNKADDFYAFIQEYPNGTIAEAAQAKIAVLSKANIIVQGAGADGKDKFYFEGRLRVGDKYEVRESFPNGKNLYKMHVEKSIKEGELQLVQEVETPDVTVSMVSLYNINGGWIGYSDKMTTMRIDPPMFRAPPELLQVGSEWKYAFRNQLTIGKTVIDHLSTGFAKIIAHEKITVKAGTFDTFKIERTLYSSAVETKNIDWVTTDIPIPIKSESTLTTADGRHSKSSTELIRFVRGS